MIASANAITILNVPAFLFQGWIYLEFAFPGADLSAGIFDHTYFSHADLQGVNFERAFLKGTDFSHSLLKGAYFGSTRQIEFIGTAIPMSDKLLLLKNETEASRLDIYDIEQQKLLESIQLPKGETVHEVAINAHYQLAFLYGYSKNGAVRIYDAKNRVLVTTIEKQKDCLQQVKLSPNGRFAFLYGISLQVQVYDAKQRELLEPIELSEKATIRNITFSIDNQLAFLHYITFDHNQESDQSYLNVYELEGEKLLKPMGPSLYLGQGFQLTLSPDGHFAFLPYKNIQICDIKQRQSLAPIEPPEEDTLRDIIISPDSRLACFLYSHSMQVYDLQRRELLPGFDQNVLKEAVNWVKVTPDSRLAFIYNDSDYGNQGESGGSSQVWVYDIQQRKLLQPIQAPEGEEINRIAIGGNKLAFLYSSGETCQVYDCQRHVCLPPIRFEKTDNRLCVREDLEDIIVYYSTYHVYVHNYKTQKQFLLCQVSEAIEEIDLFSLDYLLVICKKGEDQYTSRDKYASKKIYLLKNWRQPDLKPLSIQETMEGHSSEVIALQEWDETGFLSKSDSEICLWQIQGSKMTPAYQFPYEGNFDGHSGLIADNSQILVMDHQKREILLKIEALEEDEIGGIDMSPDGRLIFVANKHNRNQVRIYDIKQQELIKIIKVPDEEQIVFIKFSPDYWCDLYLMSEFDMEQCREIKGNAVILTNRNTAYFIFEDKLLLKENEPQMVEDIDRRRIARSESIRPEKYTALLYKRIQIINEALFESGLRRAHPLAFLFCENQIQIYDMEQRELLQPIVSPEKYSDSEYSHQFSENGQMLFLALAYGNRHEAHVYDLQRRMLLKSISAPKGEQIDRLHISHKSHHVFIMYNQEGKSVDGSHQVGVYDTQRKQLLAPILVPKKEKVTTVEQLDHRLAFLFNDSDMGSHVVQVYDIERQMLLPPIQLPPEEKINNMQFTPDYCLVFLYNRKDEKLVKRHVQVYDVVKQALLAPIQLPDNTKIDNIIFCFDNQKTIAFFLLNQQNRDLDNTYALVYDFKSNKLLTTIELASPAASAYLQRLNCKFHDERLVLLYNDSGSLYDVSSQKILKLEIPEGQKIDRGETSADGRLAFLYDCKGSNQIQLYDFEQQIPLMPIQLPKDFKIENILEIKSSQKTISFSSTETTDISFINSIETKELKQSSIKEFDEKAHSRDSNIRIILYGFDCCFLWQSSTSQLIPLVEGIEITNVLLLKENTQLITAGRNGICRLWDISNFEKPLLKFSTGESATYAMGAKLDSAIHLSPDNSALFNRKGAIVSKSKLITEVEEEKSKRVVGLTSSIFSESSTLSITASSSSALIPALLSSLTTGRDRNKPLEHKINIDTVIKPPVSFVRSYRMRNMSNQLFSLLQHPHLATAMILNKPHHSVLRMMSEQRQKPLHRKWLS